MTLDNKAYVVKVDVKLDRQSAHNLSVRATVADHAQDELLAQYPGHGARLRGCSTTATGCRRSYTGVLSPNLINVSNFGLTRIGLKRTGTMAIGLTHDSIDSPIDYSSGARPFARTAPTYNFTNDLTWNKGAHSITMGGNVRFVRNDRTSYANAFPTISFGRGNLNGLGSDIVGRHAELSRPAHGQPGACA